MRYAILLGRILFSAIFILSAPGHFSRDEIQQAASHGLPMADVLVPLAGIIALLGGLSVLLGYKTRAGAWLLVLFLVPVTLVMHNFWAVTDPMMAKMQQVMFMKNLTMIGGSLAFAYFGAGAFSLDARTRLNPRPDVSMLKSKPAAGHA